MGLIGKIIGAGHSARGIGAAVGDVAEVFVGNRSERESDAHEAFMGALEQFGEEFQSATDSPFDRAVNGLNRLPRPMLALGTIALFTYAMAAPAGFSERMAGLALVPEPLWWLLGAIVSFYFGARELHHIRARQLPVRSPRPSPAAPVAPAPTAEPAPAAVPPGDPDYNAAVEEWRRRNG